MSAYNIWLCALNPVSYTHLPVDTIQSYPIEERQDQMLSSFTASLNPSVLESPINTSSVSYTHLDVYKRQGMNLGYVTVNGVNSNKLSVYHKATFCYIDAG